MCSLYTKYNAQSPFLSIAAPHINVWENERYPTLHTYTRAARTHFHTLICIVGAQRKRSTKIKELLIGSEWFSSPPSPPSSPQLLCRSNGVLLWPPLQKYLLQKSHTCTQRAERHFSSIHFKKISNPLQFAVLL